jgi:hypothetical protein
LRPDTTVYSALSADDWTPDCLLLDEGEGGSYGFDDVTFSTGPSSSLSSSSKFYDPGLAFRWEDKEGGGGGKRQAMQARQLGSISDALLNKLKKLGVLENIIFRTNYLSPRCLRHRHRHRAPSSVPVALVVAVAAKLYNQRGGREVALDAIVTVVVTIVVVIAIVAVTVTAVVAVSFAIVIAFAIVVAIAFAAVIVAAAVAISIVGVVPIVVFCCCQALQPGGEERSPLSPLLPSLPPRADKRSPSTAQSYCHDVVVVVPVPPLSYLRQTCDSSCRVHLPDDISGYDHDNNGDHQLLANPWQMSEHAIRWRTHSFASRLLVLLQSSGGLGGLFVPAPRGVA